VRFSVLAQQTTRSGARSLFAMIRHRCAGECRVGRRAGAIPCASDRSAPKRGALLSPRGRRSVRGSGVARQLLPRAVWAAAAE
jgi:hypothetical protein